MATYWENSCSFGLRYVSWYKYLIVSLVFSHLVFWSGNLFLIAPFPDLCLLVPFHWRRGKLDRTGEECGIRVYDLCGIQGACGCRSNVSSLTLCSLLGILLSSY